MLKPKIMFSLANLTVKRMLDLVLAIILTILFSVPMILLAFAVRLTSSGPILFWSDRVGR